jgi:protein-tyrosine phosphatase
MIDLHSHILPGLDDGARTMPESLEIARDAVDEGIELIAATPHVRHDYPTSPETMERAVAELAAELARAGLPLEVRPGGEIALDFLPQLGAVDLSRFGLGGNPAYLLLEFPYRDWPLGLRALVYRLRSTGVVPVLAHPERNAEVRSAPERLRALVDAGALVQLTCASIDGRLGRFVRETGLRLLDLELAHMLGSDAHSHGVRAIGMRAAAEALGDEGLAQWLVHDVPAAIVHGQPLPDRPSRRRSLQFSLFRPRGRRA